MNPLVRKNSITYDQTEQLVIARLFEDVDTDYCKEGRHKFPNQLEFRSNAKELFGNLDGNDFIISGKRKIFRSHLPDVWIRGRFIAQSSSCSIDYKIGAKIGIYFLFLVMIGFECLLMTVWLTSSLPSADELSLLLGMGMIGLFAVLSYWSVISQIKEAEKMIRNLFGPLNENEHA